MNEYDIASAVWAGITPKVEKLQKLATKLGTRFELTVSAPFTKVVNRRNGAAGLVPTPVEFVRVSIDAEVPRFAGWAFRAAIDHGTEAGNVIRSSPRVAGEIPAHYRTDAPTCDHCRTVRARHTTHVLQHDDGRWVRVGANCLRDFLGHNDPNRLVEYAALFDDVSSLCGAPDDEDSEIGGGGSHARAIGVASIVAASFAAIREMGSYVSRKAADAVESSTGRWVETTGGRVSRARNSTKREDRLEITPEDTANATVAIEWVLAEYGSRPVESLKDFEHNLLVIAKSAVVSERKHAGIACYIAEAYRRHLGILAERKAAATRVNEHAGAVGERKAFGTAVVYKVSSFEGDFGTTYTYMARDLDGRTLKIRSSHDLDSWPGAVLVVTRATVKACEEFEGRKITVLNRVEVADLFDFLAAA